MTTCLGRDSWSQNRNSSPTFSGAKIIVEEAVQGPSGKIARIRSVWKVAADGLVNFDTAVPR